MEGFAEYARDEGIDFCLPDEVDDQLVVEAIHNFENASQFIIERVKSDHPDFELELYVIDDKTFNAFAGTFSDAEVIGINRGVFNTLKKKIRKFYPFAFSDNKSVKADVHRSHGNLIFHLAVLYILRHELSHILNGHTRWSRSEYGVALLREVEIPGERHIPGLEYETFEWDADASAVQSVMEAAMQPIVTNVGGRDAWAIPDTNDFGSREFALQMAFQAILVCALHFAENSTSDWRDPQPSSHPHPIIRLHHLLGQFHQVIAFRTGQSYQDTAKANVTALIPLITEWNRLSVGKAKLNLQAWASQEARDIHMARMEAYTATWAALKGRLDDLKRGTMLAPEMPVGHPAYPENDAIG